MTGSANVPVVSVCVRQRYPMYPSSLCVKSIRDILFGPATRCLRASVCCMCVWHVCWFYAFYAFYGTYVCVYVNDCVRLHVRICARVCLYVMFVGMCVCAYVYMYVYVCVSMCMYIHICMAHTYIHAIRYLHILFVSSQNTALTLHRPQLQQR